MEPLGLSANALAKALHVPPNRITAILNGTRSITADTALRLARYFSTPPQSSLNLQKNYELEVASGRWAESSRPRSLPELHDRQSRFRPSTTTWDLSCRRPAPGLRDIEPRRNGDGIAPISSTRGIGFGPALYLP
jgi:addiction module HigA family antidote